jgi:hypothetical protein
MTEEYDVLVVGGDHLSPQRYGGNSEVPTDAGKRAVADGTLDGLSRRGAGLDSQRPAGGRLCFAAGRQQAEMRKPVVKARMQSVTLRSTGG